MNLDYTLLLFAGVDVPIPELQISMHAPTVKEIARMGEHQYFMASQYLCLQKEQLVQDKSLLSSISNFQVLMKVLEQSKDKEKRFALINLLTLLFPGYTPLITKNSIILTSQEEGQEPILIDTDNFDIVQNVAKEVLCIHSLFQGDNIIYNPVNRRAQEIADKLMKAREKIQQLKAQNGEGNVSILTRYISILAVAQVTTLSEGLNLNIFQLFDLMERYNGYVAWDADFRVRLAGGSPETTPESWMRDLYDNQVQTPVGAGSDQIQVYKK